jgi:WD40 repeat protein
LQYIQIGGRYKLSLVFKGHTDINIPAKSIGDDDLEDAKDLWCCGFEPTRPRQTQTSNMVAFCGSYTVLFLDTHLKSYTKKYTHPEVQEIFYCMAWTTLSGKEELLNADINEEDPSCNILAVAGRMGSIKLLNPLQNDCYRYLFGHDKPVLKLAFAKTEPRWLFSASADKTVRLWDIGSPTSKQDDSVCLAKFNLPAKSGVPSALSISHDLKTLMVGFEGGDMITFIITDDHIDTFRTKAEEFRSKESQSKNKWDRFGALAIIEPKSIFPQGDEWHEGYIDDIYIFGQDGDTSNKLYNKISK